MFIRSNNAQYHIAVRALPILLVWYFKVDLVVQKLGTRYLDVPSGKGVKLGCWRAVLGPLVI